MNGKLFEISEHVCQSSHTFWSLEAVVVTGEAHLCINVPERA